MKLLTLKFFIVSWFFLSTVFLHSNDNINIDNITIHKKPVKYNKVFFKNINNEEIELIKFKKNLIIINFWATWCAPCKEEMPHLDKLQANKKLTNLKIFPINVGNDNNEKQIKFFSNLNIKNLKIYFDSSGDLPNQFMLRGLPTTIFINKKGEEFARILGFFDFNDKKFIKWLESYN